MKLILLILILLVYLGCGRKGGQWEDEVYSRHLQRQVKLTIIHTRIPTDRNTMHLLLLNDGQEMEHLRVRVVVDSLEKLGILPPLVVVGIHAGDRIQEYGVSGKPDYAGHGAKAAYYERFIERELLPYIRKKTGVRKFRSSTIAGCSLGGLSAFDIAWNLSDKFERVGIFSGSFWWRDKDITDSSYSDNHNRIVIEKIKASRKTPSLRLWFYAGEKEETSDRDRDGVIDVVDDTKDVAEALIQYRHLRPEQIHIELDPPGRHDWIWWSRVFPDFLRWAYENHR